MAEIIPAIIPKDFEDLRKQVTRVDDFVSTIQIDVVDGVYVPQKGWPYTDQGASVAEDTATLHMQGVSFEVDLMIANVQNSIDEWIASDPVRIILHVEQNEHLDVVIQKIKSEAHTVEIGLAINTTTSIDELAPHISNIDFVQCMGIAEIGSQGQPFDERVLAQVRTIKETYPDMIVSVDGGVSLETASKLIAAGAARLVSGSGILKSDYPGDVIRQLQELS